MKILKISFKAVRFMTGFALHYKKGFFSRWKNVCYGDFYPTFPEEMLGKVITFDSRFQAYSFAFKLLTGMIIPQPKNSVPESPHIVGSTYLPN